MPHATRSRSIAVLTMFVALLGFTAFASITPAQAAAPAPNSDPSNLRAEVRAAKQSGVSNGPAAVAAVCARGVACFWTNSGYSGTLETKLGSQHGCFNFSSRVNNLISSLSNNSGQLIRVYKDANCTGIQYKNYPDTYGTSNLQYTGYNDTFSSVRVNP